MAPLITTLATLSTGQPIAVEAIETPAGWHARPALGQCRVWDNLFPASGGDYREAVAAVLALCERQENSFRCQLTGQSGIATVAA